MLASKLMMLLSCKVDDDDDGCDHDDYSEDSTADSPSTDEG